MNTASTTSVRVNVSLADMYGVGSDIADIVCFARPTNAGWIVELPFGLEARKVSEAWVEARKLR